VRVFDLASIIAVSVSDPNFQVGEPLLLLLHHAKLVTMYSHGMLLYSEERLQGDVGSAYTQEWSDGQNGLNSAPQRLIPQKSKGKESGLN
jgi:hypothetical protein